METVSCKTSQWVSTSPYVKLTISEASSNETTTTLRYTLYYEASSAANTSVAKSYTIKIGDWSTSGTYNINGFVGQDIITTGTRVIEKTKVSRNIPCSCTFGFELTWSGVYCGVKTASTVITIDAITSYQVTYNANGGTGAPSAQTKWQGETLTLSSTKPTRTGYIFQGWGTSAADTTVDYKPGASYTANAATTLYAIWKANTYTVSYNANGGTGVPAAQTKTHGVSLTLTTLKPTRTNYTFKGWATSSAGDVSYQAGGAYTNNAAIILYAVWELSYVLPKIWDFEVYWTSHATQYDENGIECRHIGFGFHWETSHEKPNVHFLLYDSNGNLKFDLEYHLNGTSDNGDFEVVNFEDYLFPMDSSYTAKIIIDDGGGSTTVTTILTGNIYPIDFLAGGKGVSFGGPASVEGTAHFQWDARFDKAVFGNVPGMNRLPEIPANDDFNNYMTTGCWAVYRNDNAETIANIPVARAGRLEVWSSTGEGIRSQQWSYLRQRYIPYNSENAVWERDISRGENNVWTYYDWYRSTLTPEASKKIYSKSTVTVVMNGNVTLGVENVYTNIPLYSYASNYGNGLSVSREGVRIGANISRVKVSGQALVKCGDISGNRHVRIQKVAANGTVSSKAWVCLTAAAQSNIVFAFTPIIMSVAEGDTIRMVYYTSDVGDSNQSGSHANGWQTYLTVEEL